MKKSLALLLASAFLVFALTACGGDKKENGSTASDTPTTEDTLDDPDSSVTDEILDGSDTAEDHRDTTEDGLFGTDNQTPNDGTTAPVMTPPQTTTLLTRKTPCPVRTPTLGAKAPGLAPATARCWKTPGSTTPTET